MTIWLRGSTKPARRAARRRNSAGRREGFVSGREPPARGHLPPDGKSEAQRAARRPDFARLWSLSGPFSSEDNILEQGFPLFCPVFAQKNRAEVARAASEKTIKERLSQMVELQPGTTVRAWIGKIAGEFSSLIREGTGGKVRRAKSSRPECNLNENPTSRASDRNPPPHGTELTEAMLLSFRNTSRRFDRLQPLQSRGPTPASNGLNLACGVRFDP